MAHEPGSTVWIVVELPTAKGEGRARRTEPRWIAAVLLDTKIQGVRYLLGKGTDVQPGVVPHNQTFESQDEAHEALLRQMVPKSIKVVSSASEPDEAKRRKTFQELSMRQQELEARKRVRELEEEENAHTSCADRKVGVGEDDDRREPCRAGKR